jgi:hypothetical protein
VTGAEPIGVAGRGGGAADEADAVRAAGYILPLHHPIRLIEEVCMVDQLSGGRLVMGVEPGTRGGQAGDVGTKFGR